MLLGPRIFLARVLELVAIFFSNAWKWKVKVKSLSCLWLLATPWTEGSSVHGIFQARVLEWGAIAFSGSVPLVSLIFLKRSLVFPILLFSSSYLHWSLRKAFLSLLAILWNSAFNWVCLSFSPLLFASLLFTAICKTSSDSHLLFFSFLFLGVGLDPCLLYSDFWPPKSLQTVTAVMKLKDTYSLEELWPI